MADTPVIEAASRAGVGKGAARAARREGYVPGVVYGDGKDPVSVNIRMNTLMRALKAGKFLSKLINLKIDGADNRVICRAVQRDVVRDLPIHADFLRLSEKSRIALFIPVEFINRPASPGLKKGGVLTIVRPEVELRVAASDIPDHLTVDLTGLDIGDVIKISNVDMPAGATPTISDRDFVIANISAPSALIAEDEEEAGEGAAEREEGGEEAEEEVEEE